MGSLGGMAVNASTNTQEQQAIWLPETRITGGVMKPERKKSPFLFFL
jgi:hypothetical protein